MTNTTKHNWHRRHLLKTSLGASVLGSPLLSVATQTNVLTKGTGVDVASELQVARPIPLEQVRLLPSIYLDALKANLAYLLRLDADRMLHNYHRFAGLPTKAKAYGGWEADTIAGEALGHYLSALSLMYAQASEASMLARVTYIIDQLERVQSAHGDGYLGGFMRKRPNGDIVDGKEIFAEIMAGDIRSAGFDLNGCWVPFYNWHKVFAGLLDAQRYCRNQKALQLALGLANYVAKVFAALDEQQLQLVLNCEHGGINESFAELFVRTGDRTWLALAERIYHHKVLDPLAEGKDELATLHANTQIPKLIGLARLAEITGKSHYRKASTQFWHSVTEHHSYVIGGHGDREYFDAADSQAQHISEQTCEACGTYNMLKLTRHLFSWTPHSQYFEFYERAHLNHILAHQNPKTGMFTYMTPLMSGMPREFSTEDVSFWCCVLSGLESHAKHGDSIYWSRDATLFVNLYIPSRLDWQAHGLQLEMSGDYPHDEFVTLRITQINRESRDKKKNQNQSQAPTQVDAHAQTTKNSNGNLTLALRIPTWANGFSAEVHASQHNHAAQTSKPSNATTKYSHKDNDGYCRIERQWQVGDTIRLHLPMQLRFENAAGRPAQANDSPVALLRGPTVMAADLGPAAKAYTAPAPALVGDDLLSKFMRLKGRALRYQSIGIVRPRDQQFQPFFQMAERRAAVYFPRFSNAQWKVAEQEYAREQKQKRDLIARSVDIMHLGEMQAERDHQLTADISYPVSYRGRNGRDARTGGFFEFTMKVKPGQLHLIAAYWGEERRRRFRILVDQTEIQYVELKGEFPGQFIEQTYVIPESVTTGKTSVRVRFQPEQGYTAGPVFGCRLVLAK